MTAENAALSDSHTSRVTEARVSVPQGSELTESITVFVRDIATHTSMDPERTVQLSYRAEEWYAHEQEQHAIQHELNQMLLEEHFHHMFMHLEEHGMQ